VFVLRISPWFPPRSFRTGRELKRETQTLLRLLLRDSCARGPHHLDNRFLGARWKWHHGIRPSASLEDCRISPSLQYVSAAYELQLELLHPRHNVLHSHRICNRPHLHQEGFEAERIISWTRVRRPTRNLRISHTKNDHSGVERIF